MIKKKYNFVKGNISNKKFMEEQISKCDAVVNFAAESHVDRSIDGPREFMQTNILGTYELLNATLKFYNPAIRDVVLESQIEILRHYNPPRISTL